MSSSRQFAILSGRWSEILARSVCQLLIAFFNIVNCLWKGLPVSPHVPTASGSDDKGAWFGEDGKTGKVANNIPCQGKHREFGNFAKTQGIWFAPKVKRYFDTYSQSMIAATGAGLPA